MKTNRHTLTTMIATAFVATSVASASLIGHFTFDNPGSIGADSSGLANDDDSLKSVGFTVTGISGGAATFSASARSYLRWAGIADAIANSVGGDFSFSVWIKTTQVFRLDTSPGYQGAGIIYSDIRGAHNDTIPLALTGNKGAFHTGSSVVFVGNTIHSTTAINSGIFTHLVVTRELLTGNKTIYVNGVQEASATHQPGVSLNERHELFVGGNYSDGLYFNGTLDDLQVYNQVLTTDEISYLYNNSGQTPAPTVSVPPQSQTVEAGADVTLNVTVVGTPPLSYQWRRNGTALPGATNAMLNLLNVQTNQAGDYQAVITNSFGSVTTTVATLTVLSSSVVPPSIV